MFGPVVTTEARLAFSCARTHSNNTAELTAMIEALLFLGLHGPVTRDEQSCMYYGSLHNPSSYTWAAGARSVIHAQHRLRFTMQHVRSRWELE